MLEPSGSGSRQRLPTDCGAGDVVDADGVDGAQVSHAVLVLQQVMVVHSHLELIVGAQNLDLQRNQTSASPL